jgi:Tat protein secretion system quality control protein TatD with DNase activity
VLAARAAGLRLRVRQVSGIETHHAIAPGSTVRGGDDRRPPRASAWTTRRGGAGRPARHERVVAVGEAGLDYHYDHSPRDVQREVFRRFVALARAVKKPLVVHTRSAPQDTLEILDSEGARDVGGVIHCFSEDRQFAARAFELGFDVSFSGIVTFKNAKAVRDVAAWAPLDKILVETDSPYLAPVPLRTEPRAGLCGPHRASRGGAQGDFARRARAGHHEKRHFSLRGGSGRGS